jgi:DnaJ family protein A protein 2
MLGLKEKTKEINHPIKCTLEDLYKGKTSRINVKRDRICKACSGKGGTKSRGAVRCEPC